MEDKFDLQKALAAEERRRDVEHAQNQRDLERRIEAVTALRDRIFLDSDFAEQKGLSSEVTASALTIKHANFSITARWMGDHFLLEFAKAHRGGLNIANIVGNDNRGQAKDVDRAVQWIAQKIFDYVK